jgi:hypothetical protein
MKLLTNSVAWKQWLKEEEGQFATAQHPPPKKYPCFGYMVLESWAQETLSPVYLYQHDVDAMSTELMVIAQRM